MEKVIIFGASGGVGAELALTYAQNENYDLVLIGRNQERMNQIKNNCSKLRKSVKKETNIEIEIITCDVTIALQLEKLIVKLKKFNIKIFIYSAGVAVVGTFNEQSLENINSQIDVNAKVPSILLKELLENFKHNKSSIILIGSVASHMYAPRVSLYFSTKNYIKILAYSIYEEFKEFGIKVTLVSPGLIQTKMIEKNLKTNIIPRFFIKTPGYVAGKIYEAQLKGKRELIIGKINIIGILISKLLMGGIFGKIIFKTIPKYFNCKNV